MKKIYYAVILAVLCSVASVYAEPIRKVTIEGQQRIERDTILALSGLETGAAYSATVADDALKQLYASGFFTHVDVQYQRGNVVIKVQEHPMINRIAFEGNRRLKSEDMERELALKPRMVMTPAKVQQDRDRILTLYQKSGRYAANVSPKSINLPENRVDLVYEIEEGEKTLVQQILFVGNHHFSDSRLRSAIQTKESAWYRIFSSTDTYDQDRIEFDKQLLEHYYHARGYADFQTVSAVTELLPNKSGFVVTFTVDEGPYYTLGGVEIKNEITAISEQAVQKTIITKSGDAYNAEEINYSIEQINTLFGEQGYAFVSVTPELVRDGETNRIFLTYYITPSPQMYVRRINIHGNERTQDRVIRREMHIGEGDPYNTVLLRQSEQDIKDLDYFKLVSVTPQRTDVPDRLDLDINVKEKSTGALHFAIGASTTDGAIGKISLTEKNFRGKGQDVHFDIMKAHRTLDIGFGMSEPYFMDRPVTVGFDVFRRTQDARKYHHYNSHSDGLTLSMGYDLAKRWQHNVHYTIKKDMVNHVKPEASIFIREQEGKKIMSLVGHSFFYNHLNSRLAPTKGYFAQFGQEFSGVGGDIRYIRHEVKSGWYFPVDRDRVVLSVMGSTGHIAGLGGQQIRIVDRFTMGGDDLRGFSDYGVGPRDKLTGDALGGEFYYRGRTQLSSSVPGIPEDLGLKAFVFTDIGSLSEVKLKDKSQKESIHNKMKPRASVGVGLSFSTPVGTLQLSLGHVLTKAPFDKKQTFRFTIGTGF
jgi:outer membrane protein insertion porin family